MAEEKLIADSEYEVLSRNALTIFAIRCAQRVLPLIDHCAPNTDASVRQLLDTSLESAANAAMTDTRLAKFTTHMTGLGAIKLKSYAQSTSEESHSNHLLSCASIVVACVGHAISTAEEPLYPGFEIKQARNSSDSSVVACEAISPECQDMCVLACKHDFERLKTTNCLGKFDLSTFGPLWPDGVPNGWPET